MGGEFFWYFFFFRGPLVSWCPGLLVFLGKCYIPFSIFIGSGRLSCFSQKKPPFSFPPYLHRIPTAFCRNSYKCCSQACMALKSGEFGGGGGGGAQPCLHDRCQKDAYALNEAFMAYKTRGIWGEGGAQPPPPPLATAMLASWASILHIL